MQLQILSGGAAQGLVHALSSQFKADTGCEIEGTFGAVGAMRDKLLGGAPADMLILTSALIAELARIGSARAPYDQLFVRCRSQRNCNGQQQCGQCGHQMPPT